jgi:hypothetical protein
MNLSAVAERQHGDARRVLVEDDAKIAAAQPDGWRSDHRLCVADAAHRIGVQRLAQLSPSRGRQFVKRFGGARAQHNRFHVSNIAECSDIRKKYR